MNQRYISYIDGNILRGFTTLSLLLMLLYCGDSVAQRIRYVKPVATGNGSGDDWNNASMSLQDMINASSAGDQVWVAAGRYTPASGSSFAMKNGVAIYGGFAGNEQLLSGRPVLNPVIGSPSGTTLAGNGSRVITNPSLTASAVLDGFVITGGGNVTQGGGIQNIGSSPTLRNCLFAENSLAGTNGGSGGAIYNFNGSSPQLTNCVFRRNTISGSGFCLGGAIYNFNSSSPKLTNCLFVENSVEATGSASYGGAIYNFNSSSPVLTNCSFVQNAANTSFGNGGAIYNMNSSSPVLFNCSFARNTASAFDGGAAIYNFGNTCNPVLISCVLFGNDGAKAIGGSSTNVQVRYSLLEKGVTGFVSDPTNITGVTTSPFAGTATTELAGNSPAKDKGDLTSYTAAGGPATDLAGNPRLTGTGYAIDMGAYEDQSGSPVSVLIVQQPPSGSAVCAGSTVSVSVIATGTSPAYQWYRNGVALTGIASATTAGLELSNVSIADVADYSVEVSGGISVTSTAFSLTLNAPPSLTITGNPALTIINGNSVTLTASGAQSYTWEDGSTGNSFTATPAGATVYSVTGISAAGCTGAASTTVTVKPIPCGTVIYVTESGAGMQDGSSWTNALSGNRLQDAINRAAACSGGQVWVAAGTYKPTTLSGPDSRTVSFSMRNNVAIYGGFTGSETALSGRPAVNPVTGQPSGSTLSGEIGDPNSLTDNSEHVVYNAESLSLTNSAVLDGFVLTGSYTNLEGGGIRNEVGNSPVIRYALFSHNYANMGAGIYNSGSNPVITDCVFQNNTATFAGAGITNQENSSVVVTNCIFRNNDGPYGGGIWNYGSRIVVTNTSFRYNVSDFGGGLYNQDNSTAVVTGCTFAGNIATSRGGGLCNIGTSVTIAGCTFENNSVTGISGIGGAIDHEDTGLTLTNCRFKGNSAYDGGGVYMRRSGSLRVINSSFENNSCQDYGGAISASRNTTLINCSFQSNSANSGGTYGAIIQNSATMINCVEFGNETGVAFTDDITATNSLFAPSSYTAVTITGSTNLTATVSPFAGLTDGQLAACSPAINGGDPSTTSAVVGTTDLAGNSRFYQGGRIDMGAYEFQGSGAPVSFTVLGSGTATCAASPTITLSGSETGVSYQLRRDGANSGAAVAGTGSAISFGPQSLSGVYTVLATRSSSSCTLVMAASATVVSTTAVPSLTLSPSATTLSCSSPVVSLSATGAGQLRWSTGATTPVISVSAAGTYSVTVTDGNSCTATASAVVSGTLLGAATVSADGPIGCGRTRAQVSVQASGATSYTLSGPNGYYQINNTGVFSVSTGGSYTGVAGQAGCVASNTVLVTEGGAQPTISSVQTSGVLGSGNCSVSVQATGYGDRYELTGPGSYVFSVVYRTVGDHSVSFPTVVKPGTYTLTVYSGNCVISRTVTVSGTACP